LEKAMVWRREKRKEFEKLTGDAMLKTTVGMTTWWVEEGKNDALARIAAKQALEALQALVLSEMENNWYSKNLMDDNTKRRSK